MLVVGVGVVCTVPKSQVSRDRTLERILGRFRISYVQSKSSAKGERKALFPFCVNTTTLDSTMRVIDNAAVPQYFSHGPP